MYTPAYHKEEHSSQIAAFVQAYPFGTLVTSGPSFPVATHLPFLIESGKEAEELAISSHMARANPHWKAAKEKESLLIFREPHAFISTGLLSNRQSVPTWNYIAVHIVATLEIIEDRATVLDLMQRSVQRFGKEDDLKDWDNLHSNRLDRLLKHVAAFRFHIRSIRARFKLGQEETVGHQTAIRDWLRHSDIDRHRELGDWMQIP